MDGYDAGIEGIQTMESIPLHEIPQNCAITYGSMVCDHWPLKKKKEKQSLPLCSGQRSFNIQ